MTLKQIQLSDVLCSSTFTGITTRSKKQKLNEKRKNTSKNVEIVSKRLALGVHKKAESCFNSNKISVQSGSRITTRSKNQKLNEKIIKTANYGEKNSKQPVQKVEILCTQPSQKPTVKTIAKFEFKIGEAVWCKLKGSSHWPARIISFDGRRYDVYWFNDYRQSKVYHSQLFKFEPNIHEFSKKFEKIQGLETAAKEALIYLSQKK